jgi:FkbM family methyltransferase
MAIASTLNTVLVHDPAGFAILVDAAADDPISRSLRAPLPWFKRCLNRWRRTSAPHFDLLRRLVRPGSRVLDLGAHIGTFTLAAASLGCEVLAVEASPENAELLRASVEHNGFTHVRIVQAVASNRSGMVPFSCYGPFGHVFTAATNMPTVEVPAVRADDLLAEVGWERVDLVKLDVEGSEIAALDGMTTLLNRTDAPPIIYESNAHTLGFYGRTPEELRGRLEEHGYASYRLDSTQSEVEDYLALPASGGRKLPVECAHAVSRGC